MKIMLTRNKPYTDERGFASIVIALILIIILALLTVGFAQLARREQRDALDKQLAVQANYAAETGINDAYTFIQSGGNVPSSSATNCSDLATKGTTSAGNAYPYASDGKYVINGQYDISLTCLLVDTILNNLTKDPLQPGADYTAQFMASGDSPLTLTVQWNSTDGNTNIPGAISANDFLPCSATTGATRCDAWNHPAVLELSVTPLAATDRTSLEYDTFTTFLYPTNGSYAAQARGDPFPSSAQQANGEPVRNLNSSIYYNPSTVYYTPTWQGQIDAASCTATGVCTATVQQICQWAQTDYSANPGSDQAAGPNGNPGCNNAGAINQQYLIHIIDYYDTSNIVITGQYGDNQPVTFSGAQDLIDATGQAKDVLKRLQVRVPTKSYTGLPDYAIDGQNICKREQTAPTSEYNTTGTTFIGLSDDTSPASTTNGPGCILSTQ